jgi:hypothetical protein
MVSVPEADEFPVLTGICLNDPLVEGVKAQNRQNHPADDLKPHIVPGIYAKKLRDAEKTKEQDKDVAQKNPRAQTHACSESAVDAGLNQSEKPRTQKDGKCQPDEQALKISAHSARFIS